MDTETRHRTLQLLGIVETVPRHDDATRDILNLLGLEERKLPRDGDGDGFYTPTKAAGDHTPFPKIPLAEHVKKWHRNPPDSLMRDVLSGGQPVVELDYGTGDTRLIEFGNGNLGVATQYRGEPGTTADYTPQRQADSDQLAAQLARAIGVPAPRKLRIAEDRTVSDLIDGPTWAEREDIIRNDDRAYELEFEGDEQAKFVAASPQAAAKARKQRDLTRQREDMLTSDGGIRLGVVDLLTGVDLRDPATVVMTPEGPAPVQTQHGWDRPTTDKLVRGKGRRGKEVLTLVPQGGSVAPATKPDGTFLAMWQEFAHSGTWTDNPLTDADIDHLREMLDDLREDFDHLGHGRWWQFASDRLDALARHATGERNIFAA